MLKEAPRSFNLVLGSYDALLTPNRRVTYRGGGLVPGMSASVQEF